MLLGHPDSGPEPLSRQFADTYETAARAAGHEVRRMDLSSLSFDPILHKGYRVIQDLEPDLIHVQENMKWCEHFVLMYPNWWGGMPALLKGMWDRMYLPSFAFRMWKNRFGWECLLKGRTARLVITSNNPPLLDHLAFGDYTASIRRSLLGFAGFKVKVTAYGNAERAETRVKDGWKKEVANLAKRAL